jgi:DNA-binding SARP family transcriptional activator
VTSFRLLGPLQILAGKDWTCIGAPKWRALLAVLLAEPGRIVSAERLIDELWGDDPPPGARKLVSGYVLRLRRLMGDPCGLVLVTQAPGYRLMASRDDLDVCQFEDLIAIGRRELAGDPRRTLQILDQALALWTGPALADVPRGPTVAAQADRLEELRLAASELRIEAGICCGHGAELVPRLRNLTALYPLRERFWQQLMRALTESERPAEALEAYARARNILADRLGADPGPSLQQLHRQILVGDRREASR